MSGASFRIDDHEWQAFIRRYSPREIDRIMQLAAAAGARAGAKVLKASAPVGRSSRPSQFYRREGGGHGQFKASVRAGRIRKRGVQARTIGYVVGPMGKFGFTRSWIAGGVRPHGYKTRPGKHPGASPNPWFERAQSPAERAAEEASRRVIEKYARS